MEIVKSTETVVVDKEVTVTYDFELQHGDDVCRMLIRASNHERSEPHTTKVLRAQAEMIQQALHIREIDPPHMMGDIEKFHQKFGLEYSGKPRMLEPDLFKFRLGFMMEELKEYEDEQPKLVDGLTGGTNGEPDHRQIAHGLEQQLDALVDLCYVALGTAYLQFGANVFDEAWKRVQKANMAKVRAEKKEDSKRNSTYDVVKPQGWLPPDHHDLVKDHAHILYRQGGEANEFYLDPANVNKRDTEVVPTVQDVPITEV